MDTPERPTDPTDLPETPAFVDEPLELNFDQPVELTFDQPVAVVPVVPYETTTPSAFSYAPPPPPKLAGPPKSVVGAALLNLTGFGLGYAYLRSRVLLAVTLVLTAALVTLGFVTGAAAQPWLWRGVFLGWVAGLGLHAAYLASRRAPGAPQRKPVLAGVAAVAVVVAGYVGYGIAGAAAYDRGVAAQENGDCATARSEFGTVTGPFELTLSHEVLDAQALVEECAAYEKAVAAQKRADYESAITLYDDFGKIYPDSVLKEHVHTNLADTHFAKATSWREPVTPVDARISVDTLLMLRREFGDTEVVKKVPQAIVDMFTAATKPYAEGKFCDSLVVLAYFAGLEPSSAGEKVVADANVYRARSLYECGMSQACAHDGYALGTLETFLEAYPNDPGVPQAKSARIALKVGAAAGVELPMPPPLGDNNPGSISVTFYNDSNRPMPLLLAGPTAHEFTIPACATCPESYVKDDPAACKNLNGRTSVTLRLTPNTYYLMIDDPVLDIEPPEPVTPMVGYTHWQCSYIFRA
jgi:hypothetical protein